MRGAVGAVVIVLALGLALRLIIAYLLPGSGFGVDLSAFRYWATNLADQGPWGFYERDFFHDYTPGYLYVLWLVGLVGKVFGGVGDLIKIPPILADLAIAWLVHSMVLELGGRRRLALAAAFVAVLNPISWFDSVVWGQVDSFGVVFLLLGLRELWRDRTERAAVYTVIAAIIKPQLGILVPLVAVVTIRRALWPSDGGGGGTDGPRRILTTGLTGLVTAIVLSIPFGLTPVGLIQQIAVAGGGYPYLTVNAYNPWALIPSDLGITLARTGQWVCDAALGADQCGAGSAVIGVVPALAIGIALLVGAFLAVLWVVGREPDRLTLLVGLAVLALAFFVLPTRVHERYGYPFFALGLILAAISPRWRVVYVVLSVATFLNMYVVLTTLYPDNPSISDWFGIGPAIRSEAGVALIVLLHTVAFAWCALQLRVKARDRLEDELERASVEPGSVGTRGGALTGRRLARRPGAAHGRRVATTGLVGAGAAGRFGERTGRDRRRGGRGGHDADLVEATRPGRERRGRLVPRPPGRTADPRRSQRLSAPRDRRPTGPPGPVDPRRAGRGVPHASDVPAARAVPDALRRGLPRPDRHRVPPVLALRDLARHLRVDAPASRQVRDGARHHGLGRGRRQRDERPGRAGAGGGGRAAPRRCDGSGRPRRRAPARGDGLGDPDL